MLNVTVIIIHQLANTFLFYLAVCDQEVNVSLARSYSDEPVETSGTETWGPEAFLAL